MLLRQKVQIQLIWSFVTCCLDRIFSECDEYSSTNSSLVATLLLVHNNGVGLVIRHILQLQFRLLRESLFSKLSGSLVAVEVQILNACLQLRVF
jgi:hypothetical protein